MRERCDLVCTARLMEALVASGVVLIFGRFFCVVQTPFGDPR